MSCATPSLEDSFERWLQAERHADRLCAMPGRATDLGLDSEDDPYRVILFSDIRPFLFPVQAPEVRLQLIYAFLNFLGLPFTPPDVPTTTPAAADPHLQWTLAYNDALRSAFWPFRANTKQLVWQTVGGEPMEPEHSRPLENPFSCPIKSWPQERSTMFSDSGRWFRDLENADLQHVDVSLVK